MMNRVTILIFLLSTATITMGQHSVSRPWSRTTPGVDDYDAYWATCVTSSESICGTWGAFSVVGAAVTPAVLHSDNPISSGIPYGYDVTTVCPPGGCSGGVTGGSDPAGPTPTDVVAAPKFTPLPGGYPTTGVLSGKQVGIPNFPYNTGVPTITLYDNTPYAYLCYTTNGDIPTATVAGTCDSDGGKETSVAPGSYPTRASGLSQYAVPESSIAGITAPTKGAITIKAIATKSGYANSSVVAATYTIDSACAVNSITNPSAVSGLDSELGIDDGLTNITVTWTTALPSNGYVMYGLQPPTPFTTTAVQDTSGTRSHTTTITGLLPSTDYSYGIYSQAIGTGGLVCGSSSQATWASAYVASTLGHITTKTPALTTGATDFKVLTWGSNHTTQGYGAYFDIGMNVLRGAPLPTSGRGITVTLTGAPANSYFNWPLAGTRSTGGGCTNIAVSGIDRGDIISKDIVCNDTFSPYGWLGSKQAELVTSSTPGSETPTGTYTITVAIRISGGMSESATWNVTIFPASAPYTGVALPHPPPSSIGYSAPIPNKDTYLFTADHWGPNGWICTQDLNSTVGIKPNDNANLVPVSTGVNYASWYYDGVNAMFGVDSLLQNYSGTTYNNPQSNWAQCRENIAEAYRDRFALIGATQIYATFSKGYYEDYLAGGGLHGQALDKELVTANSIAPEAPTVYTGGSYLNNDQRNVAYNLEHYIDGAALGVGDPVAISAISGTGASGPFIVTITSNLFQNCAVLCDPLRLLWGRQLHMLAAIW